MLRSCNNTSHNQLEALSERRPSLAEADHYSHIAHCKNIEAWWWKTTPLKKKKKKKKKKSFGSLPLPQSGYATTIMVFFAHLFLLIYSSQKVPTSLKFYRALHILVLHMHRKIWCWFYR